MPVRLDDDFLRGITAMVSDKRAAGSARPRADVAADLGVPLPRLHGWLRLAARRGLAPPVARPQPRQGVRYCPTCGAPESRWTKAGDTPDPTP